MCVLEVTLNLLAERATLSIFTEGWTNFPPSFYGSWRTSLDDVRGHTIYVKSFDVG